MARGFAASHPEYQGPFGKQQAFGAHAKDDAESRFRAQGRPASAPNGPMIAEALTSALAEPIDRIEIETADRSVEVIDPPIEAIDLTIETADPSIEAADP